MTSRNSAEGHDPADLGELEREVMQLIWRYGNATADRVREELPRSLKDATVRTVLRRLEEKGYVSHKTENRTFIYEPAEARPQVAARAVKRIVDWVCAGSVEALLVGMVDGDVLDKKELKQLAEKIATAKRGGK